VARGLVTVDFDHFGALKLTDACRPILRGEQQLMLRKDVAPEKTKRGKNGKKGGSKPVSNTTLWDALRAQRREIADKQNVPPYVIFHDATLMAMCESRPANRQQMAMLSGVGERKLELYGEPFLAVIRQFSDDSDTVTETINLFKRGYTVRQVAEYRALKEDTIYSHLSQALEQGMLALSKVVELSEQEIKRIEDTMLNLPEEQRSALKPIYELFDGQYSYSILRCVRAALLHQTA
jgi:ATP-dependent DNA helicase RecQ